MQTITTEIAVREPALVALRSVGGELVLPANGAVAEAPLGEGRFAMGPGSSAAFTVGARREADGGISLDWATTLPINNGDRHTLLPAGLTMVLPREASTIVTPQMLKAPTLVLPWCTSLEEHVMRGVVSYRAEPYGCVAPDQGELPRSSTVASVGYRLDIPWSDVEVRGKLRPQRKTAWFLIGVSTAAFGGITALVASFPSSSYKGGTGTKAAFVSLTTGIMLAFDIPLLFTAVKKDRDVVLRPRAP